MTRIPRPSLVAVLTAILLAGLLAAATVTNAGGPAARAKAKTTVELKIKPVAGGLYEYKVTLKSTDGDCVKGRNVLVFHDENKNDDYDPGEYKIGKGKSDDEGNFQFKSNVIPPKGDHAAVFVRKTGDCKGGRTQVKIK